MKTKTLFLLVLASGALSVAQTPPSGVISRFPSASDSRAGHVISAEVPDSYSLDEVATQLRELHRVVDATLPMLNAVTKNDTNSVAGGQSTGRKLAGILGDILRGNTNDVSGGSSTSGNTNGWGKILRDVLGTNATASASSETSTLSDLATLREQLRGLTPVLERLDSSALTTSEFAQPRDHSSTNGLVPTGRE